MVQPGVGQRQNLPHMEPRMIEHTLENVIIPVTSHETFPNRLISWVLLVLRGFYLLASPGFGTGTG